MRKLRSHYSNFFHTLAGDTGWTTITDGRGTSTFTGSATYGFWFHWFMTGCHHQMGDTWMLDKAVTLEEVLHCFVVLEEEWQVGAGDMGK